MERSVDLGIHGSQIILDIRMRILAITNMYPTCKVLPSGIFVEQQINGLRAIGLDVDLMFVERLEKGMTSYVGLGNRIRSRLAALQHTVVHVMYGGVMANIVTRAVKDRPTIVTFHGSDLLGENLSGCVRRIIAGYGVWASYRAARRASRIVTVSTVLRDALPHDIDRRKVRVIPCGIDLERFKPLDRRVCQNALGWDRNKFHVLFPANGGDPVKRFHLAQTAVKLLNASRIKAQIHQLRGVKNSEVPVWLNASDVLLLTSLHEGSPTIVKEALACDLPIVSVDVGDVRERLNGIAGCYLSSSRPEDLAAGLFTVYAGNRRVDGRVKMQALSLESIALQLKNVYEDLVLSSENTQWGNPPAVVRHPPTDLFSKL
jgi:teichuronic acid biosynthesis glycosyltransferase TuaC